LWRDSWGNLSQSFESSEPSIWPFVAPAKTPKEIVDRLNRELAKVLATPEVREQLLANGMEPEPSSVEELAKHIDSQLALWGRVVKEAGIEAQ
jgi:tripartite-type tricarboxylate transporter receptor subunit TctC